MYEKFQGCHQQTFIHCEETLAEDVAATSELYPKPAVCGDEGFWDLISTKSTWEVGEKGQEAVDNEMAGGRWVQQCLFHGGSTSAALHRN